SQCPRVGAPASSRVQKPLSNSQHEQELAGCGAGAGPKVQYMQRSVLALHPVGDLEKVLRRASQPVEFGHDEGVALIVASAENRHGNSSLSFPAMVPLQGKEGSLRPGTKRR